MYLSFFDEKEKKKKRKNEVGCVRNGKDLGIVGGERIDPNTVLFTK